MDCCNSCCKDFRCDWLVPLSYIELTVTHTSSFLESVATSQSCTDGTILCVLLYGTLPVPPPRARQVPTAKIPDVCFMIMRPEKKIASDLDP